MPIGKEDFDKGTTGVAAGQVWTNTVAYLKKNADTGQAYSAKEIAEAIGANTDTVLEVTAKKIKEGNTEVIRKKIQRAVYLMYNGGATEAAHAASSSRPKRS